MVTAGGGLLGVGLAIAASPLMPMGPARLAEPSPGVEVNLAVLGAGLAVTAVLPVLLAGLPLGLLAGRWAWVVFTSSAGVSGTADVSLALVLLAVPATLLLANLIAAGPGWTAARAPAATLLRSE
jgi:hypothetical protein